MTDDPWNRLGAAIKSRMDETGVTPESVEAFGGPKPTKLRELVNQRATTLRDSLKPGLERALRWAPGDINRILAGEQPTPLVELVPSAAQREVLDRWFSALRLVDSVREIPDSTPSLRTHTWQVVWAFADLLIDQVLRAERADGDKEILDKIYQDRGVAKELLIRNLKKEPEDVVEVAPESDAQAQGRQAQEEPLADGSERPPLGPFRDDEGGSGQDRAKQ